MISIEKRDKIEIISFNVNKIDALISDDVRERIRKLFDTSHSRVILDLKGVEYIDSSGFGCLLSILRDSRNSFGVLKLVNPEPRIMDLIQTLHLHTVFQIYDDMDACISAIR